MIAEFDFLATKCGLAAERESVKGVYLSVYASSVSTEILVFLIYVVLLTELFFWFACVSNDLVPMLSSLCGRCTLNVTYCIILRFVLGYTPT